MKKGKKFNSPISAKVSRGRLQGKYSHKFTLYQKKKEARNTRRLCGCSIWLCSDHGQLILNFVCIFYFVTNFCEKNIKNFRFFQVFNEIRING